MAAPTVGSNQANPGQGTSIEDLKFGMVRQLADGSYSEAHSVVLSGAGVATAIYL